MKYLGEHYNDNVRIVNEQREAIKLAKGILHCAELETSMCSLLNSAHCMLSVHDEIMSHKDDVPPHLYKQLNGCMESVKLHVSRQLELS